MKLNSVIVGTLIASMAFTPCALIQQQICSAETTVEVIEVGRDIGPAAWVDENGTSFSIYQGYYLAIGLGENVTELNVGDNPHYLYQTALKRCSGLKTLNLKSTFKGFADFKDYTGAFVYDPFYAVEGEVTINYDGTISEFRSLQNWELFVTHGGNTIVCTDGTITVGDKVFIDSTKNEEESIGQYFYDKRLITYDGDMVYHFEIVQGGEEVECTKSTLFTGLDLANHALSDIDYAALLYAECSDETVTEYVLPDTLFGYNIEVVGNSNCILCEDNNVTKVVLPSYTKAINPFAFEDCTKLENIIPSTIVLINQYAFKDCTSLKYIELPDNLFAICKNAFYNCDSLTSIELPSNLHSLDNYAFAEADNLKTLIFNCIPDWIFNRYIFKDSSIENIVFADGITKIESISEVPWSYIENLKSVILPGTLTEFYDYFYLLGADNVYFNGTKEEWNNVILMTAEDGKDQGINDTDDDGYIRVCEMNDSSINKVITNDLIITTENGLKYTVTSACIAEVVGYEGESVDVVIPNTFEYNSKTYTVRTIDYEAFKDNTMIKSIDLSNVESAFLLSDSRGIFSGCTSLEKVILSDKIHYIGARAFKDCTNLKSIDLPESLTDIFDSAFYGSGIESIVIPENVTNIECWAFKDCKNLKSIELYNNVKCFINPIDNCNNLKTIYYHGTEEQWNNILIHDLANNLDYIDHYCYRDTVSYEDTNNDNKIQLGEVTGLIPDDVEIIFLDEDSTKGDINNDNLIDIRDVIQLNKVILGIESSQEGINYDINEDGNVSSADSLVLMKYCVGLVAKL